MQVSCVQFFDEWRERLEHDPDFWAIRTLQSDRFWRNKAWRQFRGITTDRPEHWVSARNFFHFEDYPRLEDAISRSLKLRVIVTLNAKVKLDGVCLRDLKVGLKAVTCAACRRRCSLVLFFLQPF